MMMRRREERRDESRVAMLIRAMKRKNEDVGGA